MVTLAKKKKLFLVVEVVHKPMRNEEHDAMEYEEIGNPLKMSMRDSLLAVPLFGDKLLK